MLMTSISHRFYRRCLQVAGIGTGIVLTTSAGCADQIREAFVTGLESLAVELIYAAFDTLFETITGNLTASAARTIIEASTSMLA